MLNGMTHTLRFKCPHSDHVTEVETGADFETVRDKWRTTLLVACTYCEETHKFLFCEGYVAGSLHYELGLSGMGSLQFLPK